MPPTETVAAGPVGGANARAHLLRYYLLTVAAILALKAVQIAIGSG